MLTRAVLAGTLGGFVVGLADAIAAWSRLGQFVPGAGGRLHAGLLAGLLAALAGGLAAAAVVGAGLLLGRHTALGRLWRHATAQHDAARARDPREALVGVSLVIAGLPIIGGALAIAYRVGLVAIQTRKHKGLVVAVAMAATLVALGAGVLLAFAAARPVELALRRLLRGRALALASHVLAPAVLAAALAAIGAAVAYAAYRRQLSLDQLKLRPFVVAAALAAAAAAAWPFTARTAARIAAGSRALRLGAAPALPLACFALALVAGIADGPRKAAAAFTGLSSPVMNGLRRAIDLDRDRYSAILGGGDCNDLDGAIHPGAFDLPDDGIDQNCTGADFELARAPEDARFVELPPGVPADANVLLITIDALRADHLGAYGYARPTSPALDALATDGVLFENGWAHAPSTRYSIPAILTGRYPSQVAWDDSVWWPALRPENRTIAEILADAGLMTGAILNYSYFDPVRRMNQGFVHYDNENKRLHLDKGDPASTSGTSAREQTDKAIAWLDSPSVAGRRFFLWVHYYDPHFRYEKHPGTQEFGERPIDLYDHEIRFTDDQIARLFAHLRARGLWDKTVVVVTGDHGEGFGEHGIDLHGYHLYAAQTRVPLILRVPGLPPRREGLPAAHVDILPTLANLAGAPPTSAMRGRSLLGVPAADEDREIYQEVIFEGPTKRFAVATRRWHLLYNQVPDNTWELYDLAADPAESRDVFGAHGGAVRELRARLLEWIDSLAFPPDAAEKLGAALLRERPSPREPVTAEWGGKVRLLGYDLARAEVRRGETIDITYFFEALGALAGDWRLFVHIEGPGGFRFQDDHIPVDGALPFSRWARGQYIADARRVAVPAHARPGDYTIYIGLWQPKKGNLAIAGADAERVTAEKRLRLGTVRVLP